MGARPVALGIREPELQGAPELPPVAGNSSDALLVHPRRGDGPGPRREPRCATSCGARSPRQPVTSSNVHAPAARKRVGIALNRLAKERYYGQDSVRRLERGVEVAWLEFDGPARATEEKPGDREKLAAFVRDLDALVVSHG